MRCTPSCSAPLRPAAATKTHLTSEAFDDVVRLTALADELQHRLDGAINELEELRWRARELESRLAEASRPARERQQLMAAKPRTDAAPEDEQATTP
jgi:hypothetical protein